MGKAQKMRLGDKKIFAVVMVAVIYGAVIWQSYQKWAQKSRREADPPVEQSRSLAENKGSEPLQDLGLKPEKQTDTPTDVLAAADDDTQEQKVAWKPEDKSLVKPSTETSPVSKQADKIKEARVILAPDQPSPQPKTAVTPSPESDPTAIPNLVKPVGVVQQESVNLLGQQGGSKWYLYKVQKKDTLWGVVQKIYKTTDDQETKQWKTKVVEANPWLQGDANRLVADAWISLPENIKENQGLFLVHKVNQGETLYGLAEQYYGSKSKWLNIQEANSRIDPNRLKCGSNLIIPLSRGDN